MPGKTPPAADIGPLVMYAAVVAAVTAGLGWGLLRLLRHATVRAQVLVVALVSVAGTATGVLVAALAMFVSRHDLGLLVVMLAASAVSGGLVAVGLGSRVGRSSRSLGELTRAISDDGDGSSIAARSSPSVATAELSRLGQELEQMATKLEAARQRERRLEQSRRELVAWVSHDLRTPLSGVRAMVEALEDGVVTDPETVARYYRTMKTEADRLAGLVDDLFELSRIQADALQLTIERVSLGDLVSDALASAAVTADAKGVVLEGRLCEPAPVVDLSTPEIARVVRNLLDNAIRHTPPGRGVLVEAARDDRNAYVTVADTCGGIPEDELDRVFDLAFRGDAARTPAAGAGAGLGLAIARGLIEAHAGDIDVRNDGDGCRFTVRLPLVRTA